MNAHATPRTLTVTALHTFHAGGGAHLIPKGSRRRVVLPAGSGLDGAAFWTTDQRGQRFPQLFRVGVVHGWQVMRESEAAGQRHASVPTWRAPVRPIAPGPAPTRQAHETGPTPGTGAPPGPRRSRTRDDPADMLTDAALLLAMGAGLGMLGSEDAETEGGPESAGPEAEEAEDWL